MANFADKAFDFMTSSNERERERGMVRQSEGVSERESKSTGYLFCNFSQLFLLLFLFGRLLGLAKLWTLQVKERKKRSRRRGSRRRRNNNDSYKLETLKKQSKMFGPRQQQQQQLRRTTQKIRD